VDKKVQNDNKLPQKYTQKSPKVLGASVNTI